MDEGRPGPAEGVCRARHQRHNRRPQTGRCCPEAGAGREHPASPLRFSVVLETRGKSEGSKTHEMEKSPETVSVTMARWVRREILGHPRKSYQD